MTRRLQSGEPQDGFSFDFGGEQVRAFPGDTVASALIASGHDVFSRSVKYHRPRGAYCLSAHCSHCLVRIDGRPNQFACVTPAAPGMEVEAQNTLGTAKHDLLGSIDWMFPRGMDHHEMFAGVPVAEDVMAKVARKLAGLGQLPAEVAPAAPAPEHREAAVAIVGAGPAGLACAEALANAGLSVEVFDSQPRVGGRLLAGLEASPGLPWAEETRARCEQLGVRFTLSATVLAAYLDELPRLLLVRVHRPADHLLTLRAERLVLANGANEPLIPFSGNDLPGVYAGRGLAKLVRLRRVVPGKRAAVIGATQEAVGLARLLVESGVEVAGIVDPSAKLHAEGLHVVHGAPEKARGRAEVRGLVVRRADGRKEALDCDVIALCEVPAASLELARQAGAHIDFDEAKGGFFVKAAEGATSEAGVFACGEVTGAMSADEARAGGAAAARAVLAAKRAGAAA